MPTAADYMKSSTGLNSDDFLKLFVTQLQNQDPLNPTDSAGMVAQMAQLTQVEQAYNTNTNLQNILSAMNNSSGMSAVSLIGKTITAQGSTVTLNPGSPSNLSFNLPNTASQVQISIQDTNGNAVKNLILGNTPAGNASVSWDGTNNNNIPMPAGNYSYVVNGINSGGASFSGTTQIQGTVSGVNMNNGTPVLTVGGSSVPLANVQSVN
jgi:flagellar basal-body rod modification protein FlgD